jgi:hypothetical protein
MERCLYFDDPKDSVHCCPMCHTRNSQWVAYSHLQEGETAQDYIQIYLQQLADQGLLQVTRRLDIGFAFHMLTLTEHDGNIRMLRTNLHSYELKDHGIVEQLFCAESFTAGRIVIRVLIGPTITDILDIFNGIHLDDNCTVTIEVDSANLTDIII